jgi:hypothetical protein
MKSSSTYLSVGTNSASLRRTLHIRLSLAIALMTTLSVFAYGQRLHPNAQTSKSSKELTIDKHFFDQSSSYCGGDNILFYNETTGDALAGKISLGGFRKTTGFDQGKRFLPGWTHVAKVDSINSILFYKNSSGEAALGTLDRGDFNTTQTYTNFSPGWTHILYVGLNYNQALFYNSETSAAALGFAPTAKRYRKGDFATGWTHIAWNHAGTLFYSTYLGSGAIVEPFANGSPGPFAVPNDLKTTRTFRTGDFTTDWTHVAATRSYVFFYNRGDGTAAIGILSSSGLDTRQKFRAGKFAPQWTHVVSAGEDILFFYNSITGSGAIGEIAGDDFRTTKPYDTGAFPRGFTHVVCSADAPRL